MADSTTVDYGLDAPLLVKNMFGRAGWCLFFGIALWYMNRIEYPAPALHLLLALGLVGLLFLAVGGIMVWSSRTAKPGLRDKILDAVELKGDEKVLDVGCGTGMLLIGAAKRLKAGRATGIDFWNADDKTGSQVTRDNAKLDGVLDKVRVESGSPVKLVYPDANFDVAVSLLAIHNIPTPEERAQLIQEMYRVLKPGGRLAMYDLFRTAEYAKTLENCGAKDVTLGSTEYLWCVPGRMLTARK